MNDNHSDKPYPGKRDPRMDTDNKLEDPRDPAHEAESNAWPLDNCPPGFKPIEEYPDKAKVEPEIGSVFDFREDDRPKPNPPELPAPSITDAHVENSIESENYLRLPGTNVTICCITMRNGFTVIGQAHCVSAENFDRLVGQNIARRDATNQIWGYLGYVLKDKLYHAKGY